MPEGRQVAGGALEHDVEPLAHEAQHVVGPDGAERAQELRDRRERLPPRRERAGISLTSAFTRAILRSLYWCRR